MTASAATTVPNARGTDFDPTPDSPFTARKSSIGYEYVPLEDFARPIEPHVRKQHARSIRQVALQILSEPRLDAPNIRYVREVLVAHLDKMEAAGRLKVPDDHDLITEAFDIGVECAAFAIAEAWLRDRGSIPIPAAE